ncbi:MAG: SpvB/TcaC N-terminal domain-containing protein, partial [Myxococcota bacterium]
MSLPKGGGAISGMGEKFTANPVTGTASLNLPLPMSPGRGGMTPSVGLAYDSGSGNGPFGLGWRLTTPSIRRKTDRGLPRYIDNGEHADTYVLSDADDLVPLLEDKGGSWEQPAARTASYDGADWDVTLYRPRIEGGFSLIERWKRQTDGRIWWRTISRDNLHRVYGRSDQARLTNPDQQRQVFEWLLEEESDCLGNVISYQYKAEDREGVNSHPAEQHRSTTGSKVAYRYLKRVRYGNTVMGHNPDAGLSSGFYDPATDTFGDSTKNAGTFLFDLVFDYGEHDSTDPSVSPSGTWSVRPDPFSRYRSGFDVRCYRLCQRVLMFHAFTELRQDAGVAIPAVVRSLELSYTARPTATTLSSTQVKGWKWTGSTYETDTMPAVSYSYAQPTIDETVRFVEGMDDLPSGLDMRQWRWVDLDGEGLSGLLTEQGGGLYYKRNDGGGQLAAARKLPRQAAVRLNGPGARLVDLDGDGNLDMVVMRPGLSGYQARSDGEDGWEDFRHFRRTPTHSPDDPDVRLIDLNGDGHADILVSEEEVFTWYPSHARQGYGAPQRRRQSHNEEKGPRLLFSKQGEQIFLADMSGDGLTDLVRVRNGSICYWPNRGYGRFGARVQMKGAPRFDRPDRFKPDCIRLADVDGSGPTDLLYIGPDGVRIWFNEAGNGFSAATMLSRLPSVARPNEVQVADLEGNGTACLVWSSPLMRENMRPLRYIRLMAKGKPWLMTQIDNGLGRTTTLEYTASTAFYLADRRAGTPWATRLPFPVHCLSRVESHDAITGHRFASRYAYHHGYFDGPEREFRGFGMVEQWDTESFSDFAATSPQYDPAIVQQVPPVRTRTWFHTGAWKKKGTLTSAYETEYFDGDDNALHLPPPSLPTGLTPQEARDAHRALKGQMLRQEVYAEDGSGNLATLYTVSEQTFQIKQLQPLHGKYPPSFHMVSGQSLSFTYDLDVSESSTEPPDPRVSQTMTLAVDEYGVVTRSAAVSYRRRTPIAGSDADLDEEQKITRVIVSENDVVHQDDAIETDNLWRLGVPWQSRSWEFSGAVNGSTSSKNLQDTTALADPQTLNATFTGFLAADTLSYEEAVPADGYRRLLGHQVVTYWRDDLSGAAPIKSVGKRAVPYQKYALVYTEGLLSSLFGTKSGSTYGGRLTETMLTDAGYVSPLGGVDPLLADPTAGAATSGDYWWIPSGRTTLDDTAFYQPFEHIDPFGNTTKLTWDGYDLLTEEVESPPAAG